MKRAIFGLLVFLLWITQVSAADRVRIGYSSISGAYTPIWVAHDAGYFAKEGLQDDIILIPSGTQLAQVTVAGEIEIGSLNGSSAIGGRAPKARISRSSVTPDKQMVFFALRPAGDQKRGGVEG